MPGDPHLLSEAFTNLMQNALEATPPGGEVIIQVRSSLSPRERAGGEGLLVPAKGSGDPHPNPLPEGEGTWEHGREGRLRLHQGVQVLMQNSGSGIPEELRERIFEPFFSSKREGTGLGLTIARRLIESHGGRLSVDSDGFSWSCFMVDLPI